MPRERVHHGKMWLHSQTNDQSQDSSTPPHIEEIVQFHPDMPVSKDQYMTEDPSHDLSWNRDGGWVQVSIDAPRDWWERFAKDFVDDPDMTRRGAFTDILSRYEINQFIKALRRARDAAYGADE